MYYLVLLKRVHADMERLCIYMYSLIYLVTYLNQTASYILKHSNELQAITSCFPNILPPLNSCSTDSSVVGHRTMCMNNGRGCPQGTLYLCGIDTTERFIIETCQANVQCPPGTTHRFVVNHVNLAFELKCLPCDAGKFEPDFYNSSRSHGLHGCSYQHQLSENVSHNLVLFEEGTSYRATRWYCDIHNGFHEERGHMLCDDIPTHKCNCVPKTCPKGKLLKPDGACIRCKGYLDRTKDFKCVPENSSNKSIDTATIRGTHSQKNNNSQQKEFDNSNGGLNPSTTGTVTEKGDNVGTDGSNVIVILVVAGLAVLVTGGVFIWRSRCCICFQIAAVTRCVINMVAGRCNRPQSTASNDDQDTSMEHNTNENYPQASVVVREHQQTQTDNTQTGNNSNEHNDSANRYRQSERNTLPPPYSANADNNAGHREPSLRLAPLKQENEGSVSNGFLHSGASSDMVSPDSGRFTEDGEHEDASENNSLLPPHRANSETDVKHV